MHKILIVDDESGIRQSLKGVLEDEGYKAAAVESGEAVHAGEPDVEKHEIHWTLLELSEAGFGGVRRIDLVAFVFEHAAKGFTNLWFVVNDEDVRHECC